MKKLKRGDLVRLQGYPHVTQVLEIAAFGCVRLRCLQSYKIFAASENLCSYAVSHPLCYPDDPEKLADRLSEIITLTDFCDFYNEVDRNLCNIETAIFEEAFSLMTVDSKHHFLAIMALYAELT